MRVIAVSLECFLGKPITVSERTGLPREEKSVKRSELYKNYLIKTTFFNWSMILDPYHTINTIPYQVFISNLKLCEIL